MKQKTGDSLFLEKNCKIQKNPPFRERNYPLISRPVSVRRSNFGKGLHGNRISVDILRYFVKY
jgi:hypothetical protein